MVTAKDLQSLIDLIKSGTMSNDEVLALLQHRSPVVRANALEALVAPARHDKSLLDELTTSVTVPANGIRLMGTISVAHVAMGCLLRVGTAESLEVAKALWNTWPERDRDDLAWYLNSEGLKIDSPGVTPNTAELVIT